MARINGSSSKNGYLFYGDFTEVIPSDYLTTNKTNLEYKIYIQSENVRFNSNWWTKRTVINGTTVWAEDNANITTSNVNNGVPVCIMSGTLTGIEHNADGSKIVDVSAYISKTQSYTSYDPGYCSLSGQVVLTTIPRASTVTCTDGDIESSISININRSSDSFVHNLLYSFGNLSGAIAENVGVSYGWSIPKEFYTQIPNDKRGQGGIFCETYQNGKKIGDTQMCYFVVTANEEKCRPEVDATIIDTNDITYELTNDRNKLIKGISNAKIVINATPKNSASIVSRKVECGDGKSDTGTEITLNNVESGNFIISATDSRNYSKSILKSVEMIPYVKLTLNPTFYRPEPTTGEVKLKYDGNYFAGSFGATNNSLTVKYRYKESTVLSWDNIEYKTISSTIDSTNNKYFNEISLGTDFDYQKSYDFEIVATDKIENISKTVHIAEGIPMLAMFKDHLEAFGKELVNNKNGMVSLGSNIGVKIYSTDEVIAGKWIDNKPVYRKVIAKTLTRDYVENNISCCFFSNIGQDIDVVVDLVLQVKKTNNQTLITSADNKEISGSFTTSSNGMVYFNWPSNLDSQIIGRTGHIIIEYTKTDN